MCSIFQNTVNGTVTKVKINYSMTYSLIARYENWVFQKPAFRFSQILECMANDFEERRVYYDEPVASNVGPHKASIIVTLQEYNEGHYDTGSFMSKYKPWVDILEGARYTAKKLETADLTNREYDTNEIVKKVPNSLIDQLRGTSKNKAEIKNPYYFELHCYDGKYYTNIFKSKTFKLNTIYVRDNMCVESVEFL